MKPTVTLGLKKAAVLCVLKCNNQFLLLKRAKEPNKNMFTPVGGKIDPFENPWDTATRETLEETSIQVDKWKFCGILTETSPTKYNWIGYVYLAEISYQEPPYCNEGILEWISIENLLNVPTPKTDWLIYKYILEDRKFCFNAIFDEKANLLEMNEDLENIQVFPSKRTDKK